MRLLPYLREISHAYDSLLHDTLQERPHPTTPNPVLQFKPLHPSDHNNTTRKAQLILLAAFQSSYPDTTTPMTPDLVPIIIDTGATVTITPFKTDFISHIQPVQTTRIQGIASGLQVEGIGTVRYNFINHAGDHQTLLLSHCLYIP